MLHSLSSRLYDQNINLFFARVHKPILKIFEDTGYSRGRWKHHFHRTIDDAIEYAWSDLGCTNVSPPFCKSEVCPFNQDALGLSSIYEASIKKIKVKK